MTTRHKHIRKTTLNLYQAMFPVGQSVTVTVRWNHGYPGIPDTWRRVGTVVLVRRATQKDSEFIPQPAGVVVIEVRYQDEHTLRVFLDVSNEVFALMPNGVHIDTGCMSVCIERTQTEVDNDDANGAENNYR